MIRTLQKKFIVTAMIAVTVLLTVLLGAVNAVNAWTTGQEADRLLENLVQMEAQGRPGLPDGERPPDFQDGDLPWEKPAEDADDDGDDTDDDDDGDDDDRVLWGSGPRRGFLMDSLTEDDRLSAVYFTVRVRDGAVTGADVSRISSVSEEEARTIYAAALETGRTEGRIDSFRYASAAGRSGETVWVFLENSSRRNAVLRVAVLSALAGLVSWGLMLLLVILLSKKAIAPIAANMERQRQFVTDAGHELKTPLAIIQANTEAMELITGESKWSRNIKAQVSRLTDLTRNLLTLARAEEAPNEAAFTQTDLSELTEQTARMFRESMELRDLTLASDVSPGLTVHGNSSQLSTLCSILMDNAVKYAPQGSTIRLELVRTDKLLRLRLENACQQLPACPPEQLFDRFYRGDSARTQSSGGFGIGLPAARVIAEQHRGRLEAEYLGENRIAFTVTLPSG